MDNAIGILLIISIHAPMKGATATGQKSSGYYKISIHAPMKGATVWFDGNTKPYKFQSTLP